ncbi:hypothetical protein [Candidatus Villigracilis affinis]|uniref:hypothetical protein n=1 Tax=Candidatus Villigracilis affinis TaxID=3140682 RepID=UPI001D4A2A0E|nr:hypothetical protein [Anaerolineales bacterium]
MQKIAAIDIGSNAIRMIVGRVTDLWEVELLENIRLPGPPWAGCFHNGEITGNDHSAGC